MKWNEMKWYIYKQLTTDHHASINNDDYCPLLVPELLRASPQQHICFLLQNIPAEH
jgi:hypothetical protein